MKMSVPCEIILEKKDNGQIKKSRPTLIGSTALPKQNLKRAGEKRKQVFNVFIRWDKTVENQKFESIEISFLCFYPLLLE